MAVIDGRYSKIEYTIGAASGTVDGGTKFSLDVNAPINKYAVYSTTAGTKATQVGPEEWSVSIEGFCDESEMDTYSTLSQTGTDVTWKGYVNATKFWTGPTKVSSFNISPDKNSDGFIPWTLKLDSNGTLTRPASG